jgi:hypothetical protein
MIDEFVEARFAIWPVEFDVLMGNFLDVWRV